jgi:hypothetical protein
VLLQVPLRLQDPGFRRPLPCPLGPRCCLEEPPCTHPSHPVVAEAGGVPVAAESSQGGSVAIPWAPLVAVVDLEGGRW